MVPTERLINQRHGITAAATENDRADLHAFTFVNTRVKHRVVTHWRREPAIRVRSFLLGLRSPVVSAPVNRMYGRCAIFALPPYVAVVGEGHVGINCVVRDRSHRVRIRFVARSWYDPEIPVLRID